MIDNICFVMLNVIKNGSKWVSFVDIVIRYLSCVFLKSQIWKKSCAQLVTMRISKRLFIFSANSFEIEFFMIITNRYFFFSCFTTSQWFSFFCSRKCSQQSKEKTLLRLSNNRNVHSSRRKKLIITIIIASCDDTFSSHFIKFERTYWLFFLFCPFCFSVCLTPHCLKTEVLIREYFHNRLKWCGLLFILTYDSFNANLFSLRQGGSNFKLM